MLTIPMILFVLQAVALSLSGVLSPGPMTAATLAAGARKPHAGAAMALGHGVIEFPLMGLIIVSAAAGRWLQQRPFQISVGLAGGLALLLLAGLTLAGLGKPPAATAPARTTHPLVTGIVLTAANPYFLLWWATVGLGLATQAAQLGLAAFAIFAILHWLCDLVWMEVLSWGSHQGATVLGVRGQRGVTVVCAVVMGLFAVKFLVDAGRAWWG